MARLFFFLSAAAILGVASAIVIPSSVREVVPEDAIGEYRRARAVLLRCPKSIEHTQTVNDEGVIPHEFIKQGSSDCTGDGAMTFLGDNGNEVLDQVQEESQKQLIRSVVASNEKALYLLEEEGRECGDGGSLGNDTLVILLAPTENINIGGVLYLGGRRYMFVDDPEVEGFCEYVTDARTEETPTPIPAPPTEEPGTGGAVDGSDPGESPEDGDGTGAKPPKGGKDQKPGKEDEDEPSPSATVTEDGTATDETGTTGGTDSDATSTTEEPSLSPSPDDDPICFPADATVNMENGSVKKMSEVEIGDRVEVGKGLFSDVYMFTHKDAATVHDFVKISTSSGAFITLTSGHYLYVNDRFAAAMSVKVGDRVELGNGDRTSVTDVSVVQGVGLYNPQTVHGDVVVNSIRASTFTRVIEPAAAQALLAPFRMVYDVCGWSASFLNNGADMVAKLLPRGQVSL